MLLEALELLQSAGETGTYVTDFALYKVVAILTTYCPLLLATFLLSQEYLGEKIACFAPENFTDGQAGALSEYCWNNGFWSNSNTINTISIRYQPHRFFAFYLAIQAVICMSPTIFWNVMTKSRLLATLKGTEEFLEDLVEAVEEGPADETIPSLEALEEKVKGQLRQFHNICLTTARDSKLSSVLLSRQILEMGLYFVFAIAQFGIFDGGEKQFTCSVHFLHPDPIKCTVPVCDLLGFLWGFNTVTLILAFVIVTFFFQGEVRAYYGLYLPLFFTELPYGDEADFYKDIKWDSNTTKHSYELLIMLFEESSTIMTKCYVLNAMKPNVLVAPSSDDSSTSTSDEERVEAVRKALKKRSRFRMT